LVHGQFSQLAYAVRGHLMEERLMLHTVGTVAVVVALLGGMVLSDVALADPPDWAPAHGRRDKEERRYRGYDGQYYERDYGIVDRGRCNTDEILAVTGAGAGGVIGNRSSSPENRAAATVIGAVIGAIVGGAVGDSIDDRDRACMGHSLALAPVGRQVQWTNPNTHIDYVLVPQRNLSNGCRQFQLRGVRGGRPFNEQVQACRNPRGEWERRGR
jgi:surface antigen